MKSSFFEKKQNKMSEQLIAIRISKFDGETPPERFGLGLVKGCPYPLWKLYQQFPDKMLCNEGERTPLLDVHVNLGDSTTDVLCYDARDWTEEHHALRKQVNALIETQ